jgi:hypothetical protein
MGRYQQHPRTGSLREVTGPGPPPAAPEPAAVDPTGEFPEVFVLRPRSRRRVTARVQERRPARFQFVTDDK